MSLSVDGVWKANVWNQTVWADGVWREGEYISSGLIGNKMFASYEKRIMITDSQDREMTTNYNERNMIA